MRNKGSACCAAICKVTPIDAEREGSKRVRERERGVRERESKREHNAILTVNQDDRLVFHCMSTLMS